VPLGTREFVPDWLAPPDQTAATRCGIFRVDHKPEHAHESRLRISQADQNRSDASCRLGRSQSDSEVVRFFAIQSFTILQSIGQQPLAQWLHVRFIQQLVLSDVFQQPVDGLQGQLKKCVCSLPMLVRQLFRLARKSGLPDRNHQANRKS
jgi:hypothetical protein